MPGRPWLVLKSPMVLFLAVGMLALVAIVVGARVLTTRAANDEALMDAGATTRLLARSVAEPAIPPGLADGKPGAVDRFDRIALERLLVGDVRRIKMWAADGTIVYSDDVRLIGETFSLDDEELEILNHGGSDAEVSELENPENRYERGGPELVEVYTQVVTPEGQPLLFEAYFTLARIRARQSQVIAPFQQITLGALALVVGVATALLWVLTGRVRRTAADRERLLRSSASVSASERRRIARDLHDGVVQDLAGSAFTIAALAREVDGPIRDSLLDTSQSLRRGLRALRSLLVEIHPPDLNAATLPAALEDLCAPAAAAGVQVVVDVAALEQLRQEDAELVWRVAQEAVRNTLRHARAATMTLDLRRVGRSLVLSVTDDGVGFDPAAVSGAAHYGLRGLESLVRDQGGVLTITSVPGNGTTIRLETRA
ncbi:histidine kinase [Nocardioides sp.]|uniref:sensor histidine kinase n=1 Tax=Nocardioides sp. TaxID=35761 RepID=UPI00286EAE60|nr:histidine kinase [Nocardioides sp.]